MKIPAQGSLTARGNADMCIIRSTHLELRSGLLLSKEILEQMDFQSNLFKAQYDSYPDGIIYGFELGEENGVLYLASGLIKHHGNYFFSVKKISVSAVLDEFDKHNGLDYTSHSAIAFVPCKKENVNQGIVSECLRLELVERKDIIPDHVLIAEFQYYREKREWRRNYKSAAEKLEAQLRTDGQYCSFMNVNYSMPDDEKVFSPVIYRMMKECLEEKDNKSAADLALLFVLSQNMKQTVSFEVLKNWFKENKIVVDTTDRTKIIQNFLKYIKSETICQEPKGRETKENSNKSIGGYRVI